MNSMERKTSKVIALCVVLALTGCATGYHRQGFAGGYSEIQLGDDTFQVSFNGNGYTCPERASDFTLLRGAEVAEQHGFPYFVIVNAENASRSSTFTTPTTITGSASVVGNTVYGSASTAGGETYTIEKPGRRATIIGLKTKPDGVSFETRYVIRSLRDKYDIPDEHLGALAGRLPRQARPSPRFGPTYPANEPASRDSTNAQQYVADRSEQAATSSSGQQNAVRPASAP